METTNADIFDFDNYSSILLVGQTGNGKTEFARRTMNRFMAKYPPSQMKCAIFDLKMVEFTDINPDYLFINRITDSAKGLEYLKYLAEISVQRAELDQQKPLIYIYIEECDMACIDQASFDESVTTININAAAANIKLIYSTSRPSESTVSKQLLHTFDLILAGELSDNAYEYLEINKPSKLEPYTFVVKK